MMSGEEWTRRLLASQDRLRLWFRRRVANEHDCDDLTQESLVCAWVNRRSFRGESAVETWLTGIAKFRLYAYYRRNSGGRSLARNGPLEPEERLISQAEHRAEERLALSLLVERLDKSDSELFQLFYGSRLSIRELARQLHQPEGTIKYRLFALRQKLLADSKLQRPWIPENTD